ncbi:tyrosine-type recombinase/integrase [Gemmata sp.]|uniref:tyrosine-type recombinase/integrase n=1 Tax=Gemmata sp. TaxID=1914242 RepID=UPI003F70B02A
MANLGKKGDTFCVRFRLRGKEFKKSLKTRDESAAKAALHLVELTLHRLHTGQARVPDRIDPGDFVVSGGTLTEPVEVPAVAGPAPVLPSTRALTEEYTTSLKALVAPSYHASQAMHLRHLLRHLGGRGDEPCDAFTVRDLDGFVQARLATRHPNTAERERITLLQFYKWAVRHEYLAASPAAGLAPIKGGEDRPPFRTAAEIERVIARGGLTDEERLDLWDTLYLGPPEIAGLLTVVRANAAADHAFLLYAIPAYTGMRRGEVLRLRWVDVDLDEGYVSARSRKQSRRKRETVRRIVLHPELKAELLAWRETRPRGQFVVCEPDGTGPINNDRANRVFWQPMRGTPWCLDNGRDLFKLGFHTYRHSFASNLAAAGVDQRVIDEFMGHTTEAMRKRYRHLFPRAKSSAIESFSLAAPPVVPRDRANPS